jgi:hypothetical protein
MKRSRTAAARQRVGVAALLAAALLVGGCDGDVTYENACPRLNHVGEAAWQEDGLHLGVWIQDLEEDPVDLVITRGDGGLAEPVLGHGAVGLTSSDAWPGTAHELVLPESAVGKSKTLRFVPVDLDGCEGEAVTLEVP